MYNFKVVQTITTTTRRSFIASFICKANIVLSRLFICVLCEASILFLNASVSMIAQTASRLCLLFSFAIFVLTFFHYFRFAVVFLSIDAIRGNYKIILSSLN